MDGGRVLLCMKKVLQIGEGLEEFGVEERN